MRDQDVKYGELTAKNEFLELAALARRGLVKEKGNAIFWREPEETGEIAVLDTRTVVDALRSEIQNRILSGAIPPGSTLPEQSVAQMFDVARPTAKAAIEQLVSVGLLKRSHNKTASVPLFVADDIADIYGARAVIENAVVHQLAQRGDVPSGAVAALDRFRATIKHPDKIAEVVKSDVDFHRALVAATGSPRLRRLHESVIGEAHMCMLQVQIHQLLHPQVIAKEHARILAMIENRNADDARLEMDAHISRARDRLLGYLRRRAPEVDQLAEAL